MKELPKINQLRNLRAVIQYGSISAASQALFQTQSTMTRSIQELERILGVSLLARGTNGVILTELGRIFEPRLNSMLNELERAMDELQQIEHSSHGTITFGCSHLPAYSIVPGVIKKFQERYSETRITVSEGQLSEKIDSLRLNRLDFYMGVVSPDISLNDFIEEHLATIKFSVVARKGHPLSHCTSLSELKNAKWYLPTASTGYYNDIEEIIYQNKGEGHGSIIFGDSPSIAEQLVSNEDYLFIAPRTMLLIPQFKDRISIIPIKEQFPDGTYSLVYSRTKKLTPVASALIDELRHSFSLLLREQDREV
ncbi:LysR substrate-binding domain-containing protein [Yersinia massiliensis]|jgi:DNA-binding transcriptional LysR family regulator|uniref:LysR family transcriptional regulator n=1 Tax=Yersinia massiliensis TaxID=419257 RepID=A0A2R4NMB5_9GAMM|nr:MULTISPECIES: LysR substrate-binding domain-containing protein [Yersinia]HEI6965882.1 LysR family transcriptional regulator [Yersinia enterocolitica]ATM86860.1 LysR family transcriptional regulator [Yersinia frederiksenii]AVX37270.1 LysR family transcriptional regulator [Yersinia massiliensis]MCB5318230.1 LysR family transcriptional regulator [Yersinia massiliensis]MDA5549936.1 LysR substrate-binding domain-containing protein [Yersinia massiliensis]